MHPRRRCGAARRVEFGLVIGPGLARDVAQLACDAVFVFALALAFAALIDSYVALSRIFRKD